MEVNKLNEHQDELYDEECYEDETCSSGFFMDECCNCIERYGIETCEFMCPFGGLPRCGKKQAEKCKQKLKELKNNAK